MHIAGAFTYAGVDLEILKEECKYVYFISQVELTFRIEVARTLINNKGHNYLGTDDPLARTAPGLSHGRQLSIYV